VNAEVNGQERSWVEAFDIWPANSEVNQLQLQTQLGLVARGDGTLMLPSKTDKRDQI
jgi:hypothetical protein